MSEHLLLACRQGAAAATAHKWGWEPAVLRVRERLAFIDPAGDLVVVSSDGQDVVRLEPGAKVYLGEAWSFAHGEPKESLRAHVAMGGKVLVPIWSAGKLIDFGPPPYDI